MTGHEGTLLAMPDGGWLAACGPCGWTSDPHDTPGAGLTAYAQHIRNGG
jgi:hypothetical protein